MKRSKLLWLLIAWAVLLGMPSCKVEDEGEEGGAIIEGTKLVGWEATKGKIKIPDGVTIIGNNAFRRRGEITRVVIPSSVLTIEEYAFYNCSSLSDVEFKGDGLKTIEMGAFTGCTSLTSITVPDSVVSIDVNAFSNCNNLTSVSATGEWEILNLFSGDTTYVGKLTANALRRGGLYSALRRK